MASSAEFANSRAAARWRKRKQKDNKDTAIGDISASMPNESVAAMLPEKRIPVWLALALGSGAFAAFNGVFAKLTTTSQTEGIATGISHALGFSSESKVVEYAIRGGFFLLNLLSNAIMWALFTRALTASTSTTRVSILNTAANFMVTAVLGMLIFGERLPFGWWCGAGLLAAGSVVIGRREGGEQQNADAEGGVRLEDGQGEALPLGTGAGTATGGIAQSAGLAGSAYRDASPDDESKRRDDRDDPI